MINYILNTKLPPLAWLAVISPMGISVTHGSAVVGRSDFFISGAWEGDFSTGNLVDSYALQGSGGCIDPNFKDQNKACDINFISNFIFATSANPQDALFGITRGENLLLSNSLCFLLAYAGLELLPDYYAYEYDLNSSYYGKNKYSRQIPVKGAVVEVFRLCNIGVIFGQGFVRTDKRRSPEFNSFEEYEALLEGTIKALVSNAQASERNHRYGLVTTISRGYDAAASSVLAYDAGCRCALTLTSPAKYANDSGVDIANKLGFTQIVEGDGLACRQNTELFEAETAAGGDVGALTCFTCFKDVYAGNMLFMGLKGDSIWGMDESYVNDHYDFGDFQAGAEQNPEHFLNNNVIAIAVPTLLGDRWPEISRISNSVEMQSYSVGGSYDRPVPRRIVEKRGIEREAFGFKKMGAGFTFHFEYSLRSVRHKMSPSSYASLKSFLRRYKHSRLKYSLATYKYYRHNYPVYVAYLASKLGLRYNKMPSGFISSPISSLLIQWGLSVITERYKSAFD